MEMNCNSKYHEVPINLMSSQNCKTFFKNYSYQNVNLIEDGQKKKQKKFFSGKLSSGYEMLKFFKLFKLYIKQTKRERILINIFIFFLFLLIQYVCYNKINNIKTNFLIGLILYSLYFLLFSLYMFSTIMNTDDDSYEIIKDSGNMFKKNELIEMHSQCYPENIVYKQNKKYYKTYENCYIKIGHENSNVNYNGAKNGCGYEYAGNDNNRIGEPGEGYEIVSLESIGKPIKEGAEGFFSVQYNYIFKVSIFFTILILILHIIRGNDMKFIQELGNAQNSSVLDTCILNGNKNICYVSISPLAYGVITCASFLLGAICSSLAAYSGIYVSVRANMKVSKAATYSYNKTLVTCFRSGTVSAIVNISLVIFGISSLMLIVNILYPTISFTKYPTMIVGYGFGASLVAMLYQLAGGIYTKAADIGADLVGKIEKSIPEDDARNPAVIADLVGDNVGDCAGQCADLFESISAEIIASMILGGALCENNIISDSVCSYFVLFPLFIHSMDLFVSTIGSYLVYTKKDNLLLGGGQKNFEKNNLNFNEKYEITSENLEDPLKIMLKAYFITCGFSIFGFSLLCKFLFSTVGNVTNAEDETYDIAKGNAWIYFSLCGMIGMICSYLFVISTRYYTDSSYPKVKKIAHASLSGPATNIIAGLYVGLESTFFPIIIICISLLFSYYLGIQSNIKKGNDVINGLYGTSIATMGMLSTSVFILSMSNFGPIADNAGGIAQMSKQPEYVRTITDKLDVVGNVTKANTKGYSVGSAALACFLLFSAFLSEVSDISGTAFATVDIALPEVFIGGILGSAIVFLFAGWSLDAVGNTAEEVLKEVRRQFNEHPGILSYKEKPDYHKCVYIISKRALKETFKPGLLGILAPIIIGILFKFIGNLQNNKLLGAQVMASFIMFSTSTGILMALFLNNAGGAWDNAKKYIETGMYGGKNSPAHISSVIGDTVGDPCKDTAGPSIHVLIKLISTITMVITPLIASSASK
ncbi:inorganic pyrophosphatase, putative [Plasmodium chabaudi adami]|uniref:H(+)-exporting diphosphatase n=1 Tax=Plasmodium chabaudi adami TaxID=5826 RepID=A0A1D3S4N7_PLACE|nr:inorganic pyrophosphatase, putative [Plasmodium chabaudi adami]